MSVPDGPIVLVRRQMAEVLGELLEISPAVGHVPTQLTAGSLFVRPRRSGDYVTTDDGSFGRPTIGLAAVIVAGTQDWQRAGEWLDNKIAVLWAALDQDERLGGRVAPLVISAVGEPGRVTTSSGEFLAVEVRFEPIHIGGLTR